MRARSFSWLIVICLVAAAPSASAACDKTLSPGADVVSAVKSAANGSTVCLNSGDYGSVTFSGIARSGFVTVQSTSGVGAAMSPKLSNSHFIKLQSMTLRDAGIEACSTNIHIVGNTWAPNTSGITVMEYGFNCSTANKQILIDGNTFVNTRPSWSEGKIGLVDAKGVVISNNLIQGQSSGNGGDGIQTGGDLTNITIGPGNVFRNIRQGPCDSTPNVPHCDSIQFVGNCPTCTITGNWFDDVEVVLQHHDAVVPVVFTNNLITNAHQMWAYSTPGSASNSRIEHNTFFNVGLMIWGTTGSGVSDTTGLIGRDNMLIGSTAEPSTCNAPSCSFTNNLCQTSSQCGFTSSAAIIGAPVFVGGAPATITTWAGWQLTTTSPGSKKGSDGQDVGITSYGTGSTTSHPPPAPPTRLRVVN